MNNTKLKWNKEVFIFFNLRTRGIVCFTYYKLVDNRKLFRSSVAFNASHPVPFAVLGAYKKRKEGKRSDVAFFF